MNGVIHLDAFYSCYEQLTASLFTGYAVTNTRLLEGQQWLESHLVLLREGIDYRASQDREQGEKLQLSRVYRAFYDFVFYALFFLAPGWPSCVRLAPKRQEKTLRGKSQRFYFFVVRCNSNNVYSAFQVEYTVFKPSRQLSIS